VLSAQTRTRAGDLAPRGCSLIVCAVQADQYDLIVSRWTAPAVALLASFWLVLLTAAPLLAVPVSGMLYAGGALICHQLPDRSFHLHGVQLPVCARCLGLYAGAALGSLAAVFPIGRRLFSWWRTNQSFNWIATAVAAAPTAMTIALEWGIGWPVSNAGRALSALPLGFAVAYVVAGALATLHYERSCAPPRPIRSTQPPTNT
jgi:uncharacterized membrane protein